MVYSWKNSIKYLQTHGQDYDFNADQGTFLKLQKQNSVKDFSILLNIIGKLSNELTIENPMQLVFDETLLGLGLSNIYGQLGT